MYSSIEAATLNLWPSHLSTPDFAHELVEAWVRMCCAIALQIIALSSGLIGRKNTLCRSRCKHDGPLPGTDINHHASTLAGI